MHQSSFCDELDEALRAGDALFRTLYTNANIGIAITSASKRFLGANRRCCEMLGYAEDELRTMTWADVSHPDDLPANVSRFDEMLAGKIDVYELDKRLLRRDGAFAWAHLTVSCLRKPTGEVRFVLAFLQDITLQKRAEEELRLVERNYREIFNATNEAIFVHDETGRLLDINDRGCAMFGCERDAVLQLRFDDMCLGRSPYSQAEAAEKIRQAVNCAPQVFEWQSRRANGELFWSEVALRRCDMRAEKRVIASVRDVTERKRAEAALLESEAKFRGIAERSFDIIHLIDAAGHLTYVSPAIKRVLGYTQEEVVGRHFRDFVLEDDLPVLMHAFAQHMQGIETEAVQIRLKRKDGERITVEINSSQVLAAGKIVGIQGIIRDVSSRLRVEERLRKLEEQISHMARLSTLGELIAGIAHELNQPLYTIQNTAKACRNVLSDRAGETDEVCGWCDDIAKAAAHAGAVVKTLRRYSRRTGATRERVGLREILDESVNLLGYEARRHGAVIELDLGDAPLIVEADRIQIQQVLVNLLRNACEAMDLETVERRKVTVRSHVSDDWVVISVEDTGPGLPDVLGAKIFEPFVTTKPEGLGLGLSICTTIVEAHGGTLDAFSNPDGGATFEVRLPTVLRDAGHAS